MTEVSSLALINRRALLDRIQRRVLDAFRQWCISAADDLKGTGMHYTGMRMREQAGRFAMIAAKIAWQPPDEDSKAGLEILSDEDLDRYLIVLRGLRKIHETIGSPSVCLDKRLEVLKGGSLPIRSDALSPARVSESLTHATDALLANKEERCGFLQALADVSGRELPPLYLSLNEMMADKGILPNLSFGIVGNTNASHTDAEREKLRERKEGMDLLKQVRSLLMGDENSRSSRVELKSIDAVEKELQLKDLDTSDPKVLHNLLKKRLQQLAPRMRAEQAAALELVDWLHETMVAEAEAEENISSLIHLLDGPMMRVALREADYLGDPEHPARKFTEAVGKAIQLVPTHNIKSLPARRLRETLELLTREIDGTAQSLERAQELISRQTSRFELIARQKESRVKSAEEGREQLDMARHKTRKILARLIDRYQPHSKQVRNFLVTTWQDYMALIFLREGEATPAWDEASLGAKALAASFSNGRSESSIEALLAWVPRLGRVLYKGLKQTGSADDAAKTEARRMALNAQKRLMKAMESPSVAAKPRSVVDVSSIPELEDPFQHAANDYHELDQAYKSSLEKLKLMSFGSWLTLQKDGQRVVHRRMSWLSPMSNRCLLVDLAGGSEVVKLTDLAQWMTTGKAKQSKKEPSLVSRAMQMVKKKLVSVKESMQSHPPGAPAPA